MEDSIGSSKGVIKGDARSLYHPNMFYFRLRA